MHQLALVSTATLLAISLSGCGTKSTKKDYAAYNLSASESTASSLIQDAVDSAGAGESADSNTTSLALLSATTADQSKGFTPTRTCAANAADGSVTVTITGDLNRTFTRDNGRRSMSRSVTGTLSETRKWDHTSAVLACDSANTHAKVGTILAGNTIAGLSLVLTSDRTRTATTTLTNSVRKTTTSTSIKTQVSGTRTITWTSQTTAGGVLTRVKSVTAATTRTLTKDGATTAWSIATSSPLTVTVERSATSPYAISSKKFTGTLVSSLTTDTTKTVEKTFTDFKLTVDSEGKCTVASGTLSVSFKESGAETQKYTCSADSGDLTCTDKDKATVEIESPDCDPVDNT